MPVSRRLPAAAAAFALLLAGPVAPAFAYELVADGSLSGNYLAGRSASKLRDNDAASSYFERALQADLGNPVLVERVFTLELAEGNIASAEEYAGRVLGFNSQQRMAHIVLGLQDFRKTRFEAARRHFATSSYTPIGELTSALLNAWAYAGQHELNAALKSLDRLDANESFANFKTFHQALIADYLGNPVRAEAAYKQAYTQAGTSLRIAQAYGSFLERNGKSAEARKLYEDFLKDNDDNPLIAAALASTKAGKTAAPFISSAYDGAGEAMFSLASAMTDDQSIDVGLLYAQLALSLTDDKPVVTTLLGDIFENTSRPERAIAAYDAVPASSPLRANSDIEIAANLQKLGRKDEAVAKLNAVLAANPANYSAVVTLGNIYRANEDFANSAKTYDRAIAMIAAPAKEHWRVFYFAGISYERLKDWPTAEKLFRRALELSPDEPMVLNYLGYSMIEKKINLPEAVAMVKKAVQLKPNDGYIVDSLGWAFYQLGDYEQALVNCERAVDLLPADPIIGEHLGDVYWRVGRKLEAQFQWQHAKDNKPEPNDLKRIEDKLKNGLPDEVPVTPAANGTGQSNG
jgi:tetratricopeptide (TPR) repeat protein